MKILLTIVISVVIVIIIVAVGMFLDEYERRPRKPLTPKQLEKLRYRFENGPRWHVPSAEGRGLPEETKRLIEERSRLKESL